MITREQLLRQTARLASLWPRDPWDEQRLEEWYRAFANQDPRDLDAAVTEAIKHHTGYAAPPLGTVYTLCRDAARQRIERERSGQHQIESGQTIPTEWLRELTNRLAGRMDMNRHDDEFPVEAS
jgi:hypothetical protein